MSRAGFVRHDRRIPLRDPDPLAAYQNRVRSRRCQFQRTRSATEIPSSRSNAEQRLSSLDLVALERIAGVALDRGDRAARGRCPSASERPAAGRVDPSVVDAIGSRLHFRLISVRSPAQLVLGTVVCGVADRGFGSSTINRLGARFDQADGIGVEEQLTSPPHVAASATTASGQTDHDRQFDDAGSCATTAANRTGRTGLSSAIASPGNSPPDPNRRGTVKPG